MDAYHLRLTSVLTPSHLRLTSVERRRWNGEATEVRWRGCGGRGKYRGMVFFRRKMSNLGKICKFVVRNKVTNTMAVTDKQLIEELKKGDFKPV